MFLECAYTFISLTALDKMLRGLGRVELSYFNIASTHLKTDKGTLPLLFGTSTQKVGSLCRQNI